MVETVHLQTVLEKHSTDMTGKVVVITGTTSGTGYCCARECAKKGATVVLCNRKSGRSESSLKELSEAVPSAVFEAVECDLQNFESVRAAGAYIKSKYSKIDVLVNNAGVMALKDLATIDGYDVQMQTNVLSHFLLTKELYPLLKASPEARIVNHTSMARRGGPLEEQYFEAKGGNLGGDGTEAQAHAFDGPRWTRYHMTKLANCCFTYSLQQKLQEAGIDNIKALLAHPGLAATSLAATTHVDGGMNAESDFMKQAQTAEDGATGIIRCAMDPEAKSGDFYGPEGFVGFPGLLEPEDYLSSEANLRINWEGCEKAVGSFTI